MQNFLDTETTGMLSNSFKQDRKSLNQTRERLSKLKLMNINTEMSRARNSSVQMFSSGSEMIASSMRLDTQRLSDRCIAQIDKISEIA